VIKLFGAKQKCAKWLGLCLGSFGCPCKLVFQTDWLPKVEGMKYAAAEGDRAFLMAVS